jgi:hypothetical protein
MDNDKLAWFRWGVLVGCLIGLGVSGGFCWHQLREARAETAKEREKRQALEVMEVIRELTGKTRGRAPGGFAPGGFAPGAFHPDPAGGMAPGGFFPRHHEEEQKNEKQER